MSDNVCHISRWSQNIENKQCNLAAFQGLETTPGGTLPRETGVIGPYGCTSDVGYLVFLSQLVFDRSLFQEPVASLAWRIV